MYRTITDTVEVREYLDRQPVIAFDIETAPLEPYRMTERAALDAHKAQIVGISFSVAEGSGIYVPLAHRRADNADAGEMWTLLAEFAADPNMVKVAHNLAFESMFFYAMGIVLQPPVYDTIAAAQLTLKNNTTFRALSDSGLKTLVPRLIGDALSTFEQVTGGRHFDHLDPTDVETVRYDNAYFSILFGVPQVNLYKACAWVHERGFAPPLHAFLRYGKFPTIL